MDKNCDNIWGRIAQIWHKTNIVYSCETETARNKKKKKREKRSSKIVHGRNVLDSPFSKNWSRIIDHREKKRVAPATGIAFSLNESTFSIQKLKFYTERNTFQLSHRKALSPLIYYWIILV